MDTATTSSNLSTISRNTSTRRPNPDAIYPSQRDSPGTTKPQTTLQTLFLAPNSYFSGTLNLANSTIGAGVLLLPSVFKEAGIVLGIILLIFGALLASITLNLLHKVWLKVREHDEKRVDYEDLGDFLFGKWMGILVKLSVIIINVGACISYLIIINHLMEPIFLSFLNEDTAHNLKTNHQTLTATVTTLVFAIPAVIMSCLPSIADLRFFSYVSLASVILFMFMVTVGLISGYTDNRRSGQVRYFVISWDLLPLLGIVSLAFACHTNMCPVAIEYGSVKAHRVKWAIAGSTATCLLTFILIGVTGYLSFLDNTCGDIVQSYPADSIADTLLRCILTLSLVLTYPLAAYPARVSIHNIINDFFHPKRFVKESLKCCVGIRMIHKRSSHDEIDPGVSKAFGDEEDELRTDNDSEYGDRSESVTPADIFVQVKPVERASGPFQALRIKIRNFRETPVSQYPRVVFNVIKNNIRNVLEGLILGVFAFLVAILFPYASTLFGLVGSTGSTMASYIFPTVYYIVCYRPSWKSPKLYILLFILIFGVFFGCFVTISNFQSIISGKANEREC